MMKDPTANLANCTDASQMAATDGTSRKRAKVCVPKPRKWYAAVLRKMVSEGGLSSGLHWSAQPGCGEGCFIFYQTEVAAGERCREIERREHWHGDMSNECSLVMLEMRLTCRCQNDLQQRGVLSIKNEIGGSRTLRWHDVLRASITDDGGFQVREVTSVFVRNGDMPLPWELVPEPMQTLEELPSRSDYPESVELYGIILAEFKEDLFRNAGLSWMTQPGARGAFLLYREKTRCKEKYDACQARALGGFLQEGQPALCLLKVSVKTKEAWQYLLKEDFLTDGPSDLQLRMPLHHLVYWQDDDGRRHICFEAETCPWMDDAEL